MGSRTSDSEPPEAIGNEDELADPIESVGEGPGTLGEVGSVLGGDDVDLGDLNPDDTDAQAGSDDKGQSDEEGADDGDLENTNPDDDADEPEPGETLDRLAPDDEQSQASDGTAANTAEGADVGDGADHGDSDGGEDADWVIVEFDAFDVQANPIAR